MVVVVVFQRTKIIVTFMRVGPVKMNTVCLNWWDHWIYGQGSCNCSVGTYKLRKASRPLQRRRGVGPVLGLVDGGVLGVGDDVLRASPKLRVVLLLQVLVC